MNLRLKINLTSLIILILVTTALAISGVLTITRISYNLNEKLMATEVENLLGTIQTALDVLEQSGVANVASYQQRAQADVLAEFKSYTFSDTGTLTVVRKADGTALIHAPEKEDDRAFLAELSSLRTGSVCHRYQGQSRFFYFGSHDAWGWLIVLSERTDQMMKLRQRFIYFVLVITLVGLTTGFGLLLWSSNKIVRPIQLLAKAADAISHGRWETEIPVVQSKDEVSNLAQSFQKMSDNLSRTYQELHNNLEKVQKSQDALFTEKERLAITLRSIGDGVISTDAQGLVTLVNKIAETLTGWSQDEAAGHPVEDVFCLTEPKKKHAKTEPILPMILSQQRESFGKQLTLFSKQGEPCIVSASGAPILDTAGNLLGVILVFRDITEQLKMQEELLKSQKLESVGVLAGGIAHDFNNILTGILGRLSLAKHLVPSTDQLFNMLEDMEKAAWRARNLTVQLLTFSKGGEPVKELVDLSQTIKETTSFTLTGSNCKPQCYIAKDLWSTEVDAGQISQVIHNLVLNASQAMPDGGNIVIRAANKFMSQSDTCLIEPGKYITIAIQDEGNGIEQNALSRIFDPYFSTKDNGSGLGLTSAYSIVKKHSGMLTVESQPNIGTIFTVFLPARERVAQAEKEQQQSLQQGSGRVLVVDDEQVVRDVMAEMLAALGYKADFALDGKEAVNKYQQLMESGEKYDCVIMDLTIPGGMGGKEAIKQLLKIDNDVLAIVASGYANDPIMADHEKYGFTAVLSKPFTLKQLSEVLANLLPAS